MFGTVVDKLQALLSRKFLIAIYFPILIFAAACFSMSCLAFPRAAGLLWAWWADTLTKKVQNLVIALLIIAVIAYTLAPLTVLCRRALQMDFNWLAGLANRMRQMELERLIELRSQAKESLRYFVRLQQLTDGFLTSLPTSRKTGVALAALQDKQAIDTALQRIDNLPLERQHKEFRADLALNSLSLTAKHLGEALERNSAALSDPLGKRLQEGYLKFREECVDMAATARYEAERCAEAQYSRFPRSNIKSTRFANVRSVAESYASRTYAVDFDYLWPRLQFVLAKDEKSSDVLDAAQNQLDYSVLLLGLSVIFFVLWLPVLCFWGSSALLLLITGLAAPPLVTMLYRIVIDNQLTLGSVIRATVDRFRLDVLASLNQAPPATLMIERQRWSDLQKATSAEGILDLPLNVASK